MVDRLDIVCEGVCLNRCISFETWKDTVFLFKRYQENHTSWHTSRTPSPIQNGLYDVCVCVWKRGPKRMTGKRRQNEGERVRQRERGAETEKKRTRKRECVGLARPTHPLFLFFVRVSVSEVRHRTIMIHCAEGFLFKSSVKIGQADLRFNSDCENPPHSPVSPSI